MAEYGPTQLRQVWRDCTAVDSRVKDGGIVGDSRHYYGYHRSRKALLNAGKRSDYSIQAALDKLGDSDAATGVDLTMPDVLMRIYTARLVAAMKARDPRIVGIIREFGGTLDSKTVTAYRVADQVRISFDSSHLWHIHLSFHRKYSNDMLAARGVAQVLLGVDATPYVWDGKSYPGAERFFVGAVGPWITYLGQRLQAHGWTGYGTGPGPTFTTVDRDAVKWFQLLQGWTGDDADGYPGPETWRRLVADPVTPPVIVPVYPEPVGNKVYEEVLVPGRTDSDSVWQVQVALRKLGYAVDLTGAYDAATVEAVKRYQTSLGDKPQYVDGALGRLQTKRLFKDAEMLVDYIPDGPVDPQGTPVLIGTWNVHVTNTQDKMNEGLQEFIDKGAHVVGVQELSNDARQKGLTAYAKTKGWAATQRNSAVTTFYDAKRVELVKESFRLVEKGGKPWEAGAGGNDSIYKIIMITEFRLKATGQRFDVLNHHVVPTIEKGGKLIKATPPKGGTSRLYVYDNQMDALCAELKSRDVPVFATSDWNLHWSAAGKDARKRLDAVGASGCWEAFPLQATHGTRCIDWVVAKGIKGWSALVRIGKHNSDHNGVLATAII